MLKTLLVALLVTAALAAQAVLPTRKFKATNQLDIPARRMWGWGSTLDGYCGECSFQSAGIYFGNYISQEEVRYSDGNSELLIAVNDEKAVKALKFEHEEWNYAQNKEPQASAFLAWTKNHIDNGHVVIAGFFEKMKSGDPDYDHIMPIIGYTTDSKGVVNGIYHNDFWTDTTSYTSGSLMVATRSECSQSTTPKQPYVYCLPENVDYAVAIKGVKDDDGTLFRTQLQVSQWYEPDWGKEDGLHEQPELISLNATVYGVTVGTQYAILRFDDRESVPTSNYLNKGWARKVQFTATSNPMLVVGLDEILSDGQFFYRTVELP